MSARLAFSLLIIFGFYVGFIIFIKTKFPNTQDFIQAVKDLYLAKGYFLIFFAGLLEAIFLVGLYIPGSMVIILGAALSKTGVISFPLVFLLGTLGLTLGYIINYSLGKYGWYRILVKLGFSRGIEIAKNKLISNQIKTLAFGYVSPNGASFISTAAGVLKIPFKRFLFLSIFAQGFWSLLWGNLAYWFGLSFVEFVLKYFVVFLPIAILIWVIAKFVKSKLNP